MRAWRVAAVVGSCVSSLVIAGQPADKPPRPGSAPGKQADPQDAVRGPAKGADAGKGNEQKKDEPKGEKPLVAFPHPLITEVYYAVGRGSEGDANGDGVRDANGDEFVELINPHDKTINLKGYVITDRQSSGRGGGDRGGDGGGERGGQGKGKSGEGRGNEGRGNEGRGGDSKGGKAKDGGSRGPSQPMRFVFPDVELKPGEVVVVFNGHGQKWTGPVGDATRGPSSGHEKFHGARVFTMGISAEMSGFSNTGEFVLLTAPDGKAVECVKWGNVDAPAEHGHLDEAPTVMGQSVQRRTATSGLEPHPFTADGKKFSPGMFPLKDEPAGDEKK